MTDAVKLLTEAEWREFLAGYQTADMIAELRERGLIAAKAEPDYEAWRPAVERYYSYAHGGDLAAVPFDEQDKRTAQGLRAALPLAPAEPVDDAQGRCRVPVGQTPLDDNLHHRLLDVIKEGQKAREDGTGSPYHGHSLEHCLHATGWVQRDLRLALNEAKAENARLRAYQTGAAS